MALEIEILKEHEIADVLWNPEYIDLFEEEWFRRVANRLLYSPFHPKTALLQRQNSLTVLEEIQNFYVIENQKEGANAKILEILIKRLLSVSGRMGLIKKIMKNNDEITFIVCQRADLEKLKEMYPDQIYDRYWLKSWANYEPTNLIITKKVQFNDLMIDPFPKNIKKIFILSDARHGELIQAQFSPLFSEEGKYLNLPDTESTNIPELIKNLNNRFRLTSFQEPYIKALKNFREKVLELKKQRLKLIKKEEFENKDTYENFQKKLDKNIMLVQTTMISSTENPPSIISSKNTTPDSEIWIGITVENKYIAIPLHTRIYIENIDTNEIDEISPSEFDCMKYKLILLPSNLEDIYGQRAVITRRLLEEISIEELRELHALQSKDGETTWENLKQLLYYASIITRRLIDTADLIGDYELAKKLINNFRKEKIEEYSIDNLPSRWKKIEDWIEVEELSIPIPAGPERTAEKIAMKCIFDVVNEELGLRKESIDDWFKCWLSVYQLQYLRRKYIKKTFAAEQECKYLINTWKKIIVKEVVPFYKILDEEIDEIS
jgi:hypothetical protein